jgi:hypothetical protein
MASLITPCINKFHFVVLPSSTYLFTAGVEGFDFSLDHTQAQTTVDRAPLDEGSVRRRDLYLTTQTLYKRKTSMPPVGFEPPDPSKHSAAEQRLRPRGHWDQLK